MHQVAVLEIAQVSVQPHVMEIAKGSVPTAAPDLVRGAAVQAVLVIAQKHALATVLVLVLALVDISARAVAIHHAEKPVHISAKEHV